nr:hypothetical protein [Okeania sp. SIO2F4]
MPIITDKYIHKTQLLKYGLRSKVLWVRVGVRNQEQESCTF